MKLKSGFTLIELLAVLVILAVIALIATPIVINIVNNSKDDSVIRSVDLYLDSVNSTIIKEQINDIELKDGLYQVNPDGIIVDSNNTIKIKVNGMKPTSGIVSIKNSKVEETSDTSICMENKLVSFEEATLNFINKNGCEKIFKCKRAKVLHEGICEQYDAGNYCSATVGHGGKITYGNLGTQGALIPGDAFDCDVNVDGTYDENIERFYYVSPKDGNSSSKFVTLVYYSNVLSGVPNSKNTVAYDSSNENWHGPVTAKEQLPTTTQWPNIKLSSTIRTITNELGKNTVATYNGSYDLPKEYNYSGYVARLLTTQEVNFACDITVGSEVIGELDKCNYLMENTNYLDSSVYGYWLETPFSGNSVNAWRVDASSRYVSDYDANFISPQNSYWGYGVRPAIEVKKSDIAY